MKKKMSESISIPAGVSCHFENGILVAKKGSVSVKKMFNLPAIDFKITADKITLSSQKGNKTDYKQIMSAIAHMNNLFLGLDNKFVFKLEACNVHFPMTLKVDNGFLIINNFLGEKVPRKAKILSDVEVDVKGPKITLSSHNIESAGSTATNIEKATKVKNRDRRIFQDGIFIVEKPGAAQ